MHYINSAVCRMLQKGWEFSEGVKVTIFRCLRMLAVIITISENKMIFIVLQSWDNKELNWVLFVLMHTKPPPQEKLFWVRKCYNNKQFPFCVSSCVLDKNFVQSSFLVMRKNTLAVIFEVLLLILSYKSLCKLVFGMLCQHLMDIQK